MIPSHHDIFCNLKIKLLENYSKATFCDELYFVSIFLNRCFFSRIKNRNAKFLIQLDAPMSYIYTLIRNYFNKIKKKGFSLESTDITRKF